MYDYASMIWNGYQKTRNEFDCRKSLLINQNRISFKAIFILQLHVHVVITNSNEKLM